MGTSVQPAGEAPGTVAAPVAGAEPAKEPALRPLAAATAAARELVAQAAAKAAAGTSAAPVVPAADDGQGETEEERIAREAADGAGGATDGGKGDETEEQRVAREAAEAAAAGNEEPDEALTVVLDGARDGEEVSIVVDSPETAERLRQLKRAALRGNQARAIREEAQQDREQAEEMRYTVEMDPAGFIAEHITNPADNVHLAQYLLTRPGVLDQLRPWLEDLTEDPVKLEEQALLVDAVRIRRKDAVSAQVNHRRALGQNSRAIVQAAERSIDSLVPEAWPDEAKAQMRKDVIGDVRAIVRQMAAEAEARGEAFDGRFNPSQVPGLVQRRLKQYGVAPRTATPVGGGKPAAGTPPAARAKPTAETFTKGRTARIAAASAPPGAGSPAPVIPKPPAYDASKPGTPIQQAAAFAKSVMSTLRKPR